MMEDDWDWEEEEEESREESSVKSAPRGGVVRPQRVQV
jgi:hypothetical protein